MVPTSSLFSPPLCSCWPLPQTRRHQRRCNSRKRPPGSPQTPASWEAGGAGRRRGPQDGSGFCIGLAVCQQGTSGAVLRRDRVDL